MMTSTTVVRRVGATAAAAAFLTVGACSGTGDGIAPGMGALQVRLTDAPFPFDSVARADLFIVRIDAKLAATDSSEAATDVDDDHDHDHERNHDPSAGWVTIAQPNQTYNLLDLMGGTTTNLGQTTLPTGRYLGFRLILDVDQSSITLKNGLVLTSTSTPGIKFPSAGHTGIKVILDKPVDVTANGTALVLDFDLGRSFVRRGHSLSQHGLLFKPVIRATATDITGSIDGTVHATSGTGDPVEGAAVEILKAGTAIDDTASANVVATTTTDASGNYMVAFLLPGTYEVRVTPPSTATTLHAALVSDVAVVSKSTTDADVVLP